MIKIKTIICLAINIITLSTCAMHNTTIPLAKTLIKLDTTKQFDSVIYLSNGLVALKGPHNCSIFDINKNKEIKQLEDEKLQEHDIHIYTDPNKNLLAMLDNEHVTVYDTLTHHKIYEQNIPYNNRSVIFNSITNNILIWDNLNGWNTFDYTNPNATPQPSTIVSHGRYRVIFNPIEQEYITYPTYNYPNTTILQLHGNIGNIKKKYGIEDEIAYCKYSPDGSLLAIQHSKQHCAVFNLETSEHAYLTINEAWIKTIIFHPHSFILAIFMQSHGKPYEISYWNTKTKKLVATTILGNFSIYNPHDQRIDFLSDGTKIVAALPDGCFIYEVPFEAQYQPDTKEKCAFPLWILKNYKDENGNNVLPQELTHLLIHNYLETHKYSFTNY